MSTGQFAEQYVRNYFKSKKAIDLIKAPKDELGYDFKDSDSKIFVEVKGTARKDRRQVNFRDFTNTEYDRARICRKTKQKYEIHLIVGTSSNAITHYIIPGNVLLEKAKPKIIWSLPITKNIEQYKAS